MARERSKSDAESSRYIPERKKREKDRGPTVMQPPLTPMIDVVFQLLLFFLLGCQFRMSEGQIQARLPDISGPQSTPPIQVDPIKVLLSPAGLEGEAVRIEIADSNLSTNDPRALHGYLLQLRDRYESDEVPVIITPAHEVRWTHIVEAFNQAVRARFKNIGFAPAEG